MTICLPFPFVTKGAKPVHIYDWVELEECDYGVGFVPGNGFYAGSQMVTLDDYIEDGK